MLCLTEEEGMILATVRRVVQERVAPRAAEIDKEGEFPEDIKEVFSELGLLGLQIPEEYGGYGMRCLVFCLIVEEIAKVCVNSANILTQQDFGTQPILIAGNEEQKRKYLPKLAKGEFLGAFGLTEPGAGSDQRPIATRALKIGNEYVINGTKRFITWGNMAHVTTVFAKTQPEKELKGISAFLVDRATPGMHVGKLEDKMGLRGSPTAELIFEDCHVPEENLLGQEGDGFKIAMKAIDHGRITIAAIALGLAQGALDYAIEYAKQRVQFGKPISEFQGIQFLMADMATQIEAARQLLYRACHEFDVHGHEAGKLGAMAKLYTTDVCMNATVECVQILGGYGYIKDYPVERMMRDAKIMQIVEGTNQIQRLVIAKHLLS